MTRDQNIKPMTQSQTLEAKKVIHSINNHNKETSLCGPAGTGKSVLVGHIHNQLVAQGVDVVVCAPTNKAASVLTEKGIDATTIHKRFFVPAESGPNGPMFIACDRWADENPKRDLPEGKIASASVTIIDEASMVPWWILSNLRRMVNRILLVGDGHQLPPVNDTRYPRGYFNTMNHSANLTEILRQGKNSPILNAATQIRDGSVHLMGHTIANEFSTAKTCHNMKFPELIKGYDDFGISWKVITHTKRVRRHINQIVRHIHGHGDFYGPRAGEKMVLFKNFDDQFLNGTEVEVVRANLPAPQIINRLAGTFRDTKGINFSEVLRREFSEQQIVDMAYPLVGLNAGGETRSIRLGLADFLYESYDRALPPGLEPFAHEALMAITMLAKHLGGDDPEPFAVVDFSYATTCHRAQGSEYSHVFVIDERSGVFHAAECNAKKAEGDVLSGEEYLRRWLYTAVTRAQNNLTLVQGNEVGVR